MSASDGQYVGGETGDEWIQSDATAADLGVDDDATAWTETEEANINPPD